MTIPSRCCLAGAGLKITWNSFATACLHEQMTQSRGNILCQICETGAAIKAGRKVKPPPGIEIIKPKGWKPAPIKLPDETRPFCSWTRKRESIYPFAAMKVGEIYEAPAVDRKKVRAAASHVSRNKYKEFSNYIENDKIFVKRVE